MAQPEQHIINKEVAFALLALSRLVLLTVPKDTSPEKMNEIISQFNVFTSHLETLSGVEIGKVDVINDN